MTSSTPHTRMLRLRQVEELTGLSRDSIYRLARGPDAKFPQRVKVSERASRWLESEVLAYLEQRSAERSQQPAAS